MTLAQLSVSYRQEEHILRERILLVRELPAQTQEEELIKQDRLRLLEAMRRDVRDVAVICERYYDRGYHINERYSL